MKPGAKKICHLKSDRIDEQCLHRAAHIIRRGGVVVFPTHGLYGLGANALDGDALERVLRLKRRDRGKPLLSLVADMSALEQVARRPEGAARFLMQCLWPGGVTFVVAAGDKAHDSLTGGGGKIGVRIPGHPVAAALARAAGVPITGTSANLSGAGGCADIKALAPDLIHGADLILDAGPLAGGPGSTVVDICGSVPQVLREGRISEKQIMQCQRLYLRGR